MGADRRAAARCDCLRGAAPRQCAPLGAGIQRAAECPDGNGATTHAAVAEEGLMSVQQGLTALVAGAEEAPLPLARLGRGHGCALAGCRPHVCRPHACTPHACTPHACEPTAPRTIRILLGILSGSFAQLLAVLSRIRPAANRAMPHLILKPFIGSGAKIWPGRG